MATQQTPVITIDGPSGTGKGTVSLRLARKLNWHYLDSGAIYRVLGLALRQYHIPVDGPLQIAALAAKINIEFTPLEHRTADGAVAVRLDGEVVTHAIRGEASGSIASKIGAYPEVRAALLATQRAFQKPPGLVTDGRDMGTVVFPQATLKIFLQASPEIRAQRRTKQLQERGINARIDEITQEIVERDQRDRTRAVAPLKPAEDAVIIDTSALSAEQVFERVLAEVERVI